MIEGGAKLESPLPESTTSAIVSITFPPTGPEASLAGIAATRRPRPKEVERTNPRACAVKGLRYSPGLREKPSLPYSAASCTYRASSTASLERDLPSRPPRPHRN
jgi:hypothetical protein